MKISCMAMEKIDPQAEKYKSFSEGITRDIEIFLVDLTRCLPGRWGILLRRLMPLSCCWYWGQLKLTISKMCGSTRCYQDLFGREYIRGVCFVS